MVGAARARVCHVTTVCERLCCVREGESVGVSTLASIYFDLPLIWPAAASAASFQLLPVDSMAHAR